MSSAINRLLFSERRIVTSLLCRRMSQMCVTQRQINPALVAPLPPLPAILPVPTKPKIIEPKVIQVRVDIPRDENKTLEAPTTSELSDELREIRSPEKVTVSYECHHFGPFKTHLIHVRRRKMKKHKLIKWRKKYLAQIRKRRLQREIAKEKLFRAELLSQVREAENFNAETYVNEVFRVIDSRPKELTTRERIEKFRDLVRKHRLNTNLIKPKFEDPVPSTPYQQKS